MDAPKDIHFNVPILFIIFNRPDTSRQTFNEIRKQKPKTLFVAADGPRSNRPDDKEKCAETRDLIKQIDWECNLKTYFRKDNIGCARNVAEAITWFFNEVEYGIILEDDIIPHPDFFPYCAELLERYKDNPQIAAINGYYKQGIVRNEASYFFRCNFSGWGWATWRRVWEEFDLYLDNYSYKELKEALHWAGFGWNDRQYKTDQFKLQKQQKADSWDWQFTLLILKLHALVVTPNQNMVNNVGWGDTSSHFKGTKSQTKPVYPIMPLKHPEKIERIAEADLNLNPTITVTFPVINKPITVKNNFLWWTWRWFRRNFIAKPKYTR